MPGPYRYITTSTTDGVLVVTVTLDQVKDYILAEELKFEFSHAVERASVNDFVLDLHKLEFITSLTCVAFLGLKKAVNEKSGRLVLCNMTDFIKNVFSAKRLLSRSAHTGNVAFEHADSLADALALLKTDAADDDRDAAE